MCLVVFSYQKDGSFYLAGNRDEFYKRETKQADFWEEIPGLIAGKDLKAGGTWLGIDQKGNIAFLTNFRDPKYFVEAERSRGELLTMFFNKPNEIGAFSEYLEKNAGRYNGYNLIFGNPGKALNYYSNVSKELSKLEYGTYGISNAYLNTSWPKVEKTRSRFEKLLREKVNPEEVFKILADTKMANEEQLPDTGVDKQMEKQLSAPFIQMQGYGTRCSSFLQIDKNGKALFAERSYRMSPKDFNDKVYRFLI